MKLLEQPPPPPRPNRHRFGPNAMSLNGYWQLILAILIDSMVRVMKKVHDEDHTADMVFDVSINFIAYGYIVIAQYIERRQYEQQQQRLAAGYEETHDVEIQSHSSKYNERNLPSSYMVSA
jgi:hypothetical protein